MFLSDTVATQVGTMALVPQLVDAVNVPVIAAGGIADGRGIAAAFALGASGVQIGTAYLFCPEAKVAALYRDALKNAQDDQTAITNIFSGRAARAMVNRIAGELVRCPKTRPPFLWPAPLWHRCVRRRRQPDRTISHPCGASRSRTARARTDRPAGRGSAGGARPSRFLVSS
jgi:NAD(P)H-dependent flavin oxidoreductase YrpB (nitropropane dioxygenase family)